MSFVSTSGLTYQSGDLFVGRDGGREIGVKTDRHAITIAGSRSGKGAAVIIPNLLRWPHNTLVIDPKGENAEKTYTARLAMGQAIHVIDPYEEAKEVPRQLRGAFNPLGEIDKDSLTASTDLEVIADGLVKRADPRHAQWDDGAVAVLAGIMAYVLSDAPPENCNLMSIREVLVQSDDDLREDAQRMMAVDGFDGLARSAGVAILTGLDNPKSMEADFIGAAKRHTKWLDKRAMRQVLERSTFDLSELKTGDASVYLVLPPDYLENDGAFLRLFVRCAISAMARGGSGKGKECLFILDEFFSLGKMDIIQKSSGSMPSYGVHLWPFLQDLGQLLVTYGTEGAETFFANSDLHQFFGNADPLTLNHVSMRLGTKTANEVAMPNAPSAPISSGASMGRGLASLGGYSKNTYTRASAGVLGGLLAAGEGAFQSARQADYADEMQHYQQQMQLAMSEIGTPRYPPDKVGKLVQQRPNEIAPNLINFVAGVGAVLVKPAPYFQKFGTLQRNSQDTRQIKPWKKYVTYYVLAAIFFSIVLKLFSSYSFQFTGVFFHAFVEIKPILEIIGIRARTISTSGVQVGSTILAVATLWGCYINWKNQKFIHIWVILGIVFLLLPTIGLIVNQIYSPRESLRDANTFFFVSYLKYLFRVLTFFISRLF